jgi:hypothetical protein
MMTGYCPSMDVTIRTPKPVVNYFRQGWEFPQSSVNDQAVVVNFGKLYVTIKLVGIKFRVM